MCRALLCLFASALLAWPSESYADPSKPIRDAMNHPASAFDLYIHILDAKLEQDFRPNRSRELYPIIAEIIERAELIDPKAKEGELFSKAWINQARQPVNVKPSFYGIDYAFEPNLFIMRFMLYIQDTSPLLQSDLSFEGEQYRKKVMEDYVTDIWRRAKVAIEFTRVQNGYSKQSFDEEEFVAEVAANTQLRLLCTIVSDDESSGDFGKLLREKGVISRTYTAIRSKHGVISVTYRDQLEEEDGR